MTAYLLSAFLHIFLFQSRRRRYDSDDDSYGSGDGSFWGIIIFFLIVIIVLYAVSKARKSIATTARWSHHFEDLQMSSQEFYQKIEKSIGEIQMPDLSLSRVSFGEGGALSSNREYLRVRRKNQFFDICAAPFGRGYFISWWQGNDSEDTKNMVSAIPVIGGPLARLLYPVTYYTIDSDEMFKNFIHTHMLTAVDSVIAEKGLRQLSEQERRPIDPRR